MLKTPYGLLERTDAIVGSSCDEKDSGVWAEAQKSARTAVFLSPSRDWDLLIWAHVDKSSDHQLSQTEIASDNPCSRHFS